MKTLLKAIFLSTIGFALAADHDVENKFKEANIVPKVLSEAPKGFIEMKYPSGEVDLGNGFPQDDVKKEPEVHYEHEEAGLYTLVMMDPDEPKLRNNRQFGVWVVGNILEDDVSKGDVLFAYCNSPSPITYSKERRYISLLYKQSKGRISFTERILSSSDITQRFRFSLQSFTRKYRTQLEGPIAGNFFISKYEESGDKLETRNNPSMLAPGPL